MMMGFWDNVIALVVGVFLVYLASIKNDELGSKASFIRYTGVGLVVGAVLQLFIALAVH